MTATVETTTETVVYSPREKMLYVEENRELGIPAHWEADARDLDMAKLFATMMLPHEYGRPTQDLDFRKRPDGTWAAEFTRRVGPFPTDSEFADCHFCGTGRNYRHAEKCHYAHLNPPKSTSKLHVWVNITGGEVYCAEHAGATLSSAIEGSPRKRRFELWNGVWKKQQVDHADGVYCESKNCKTRPEADS
ncbi:hypothetical protein ACT17_22925 [Mycolicibacterium conceptionense]|uniref:Uncharacterized protein n=1 Tax=Mycolicibacterium conceptionense TaxID=451644 RepID=A0A0J8U681_9MYCO|nr:hypothetical protein [Mycolicibacterium conceptionense]KMV15950.1 hypothetical protein ACT17_22925 [Mycolicibacterium conceptionense]